MPFPSDWNELDRALAALRRNEAALPELIRQLGDRPLFPLIPFHPEVEGATLTLRNGVAFPFLILRNSDGNVVPIYSSLERVEEGLRAQSVPDRTYSPAEIHSRDLFEILVAIKLRAVLNKSCATGDVILPLNLMRDVTSGEALRPLPPDQPKSGALQIIDPAEYPTQLVHSMFELVRQHREFRAAWLFRSPEPPEVPGRVRYQLLVLMNPRDDRLFHDLNLVSQSACPKDAEVYLGHVRGDVDRIRSILAQAQPFYAAVDFDPHNPLPG